MGCKIVRYSPVEQLATHYSGHDAVIRFGKSPDDFLPWAGELPQIVLFSHLIKARFPVEYESVIKTLDGFPYKIGGAGNEDIPGSIGLVSYDEQIDLLKSSRVYLYGVGTFITYTLNFIEAWMSGIPVIVLDGRNSHPPETFRFAEVQSLIEHGRKRILASTVEEARQFISALLADRQVAQAIGQEGRLAASSLFGDSQRSQRCGTNSCRPSKTDPRWVRSGASGRRSRLPPRVRLARHEAVLRRVAKKSAGEQPRPAGAAGSDAG